MNLVVQKYGGTSVGDIARIKEVAKKIVKAKQSVKNLVVVVSAMAGETNKLLDLAHQVNDLPDERELDLLLSSGERVSAALLAMAVQSLGYEAKSFTGRQVGIHTDSAYTRARIKWIDTDSIYKALDEGKIAVVAGFQGIDEKQNVTTLGRGGSDTTAVALAAALNADLCEIYTDVDGVYTTDPNIVPSARKIDKISYDEMLELASLGAKVLQTRSVEFAGKYGVPLVVKSSFKGGDGTLVTKEDADMERVVVSGVALSRDQAKITLIKVVDKPGIAAKIFGEVAKTNMVVDMIIQNISEGGLTDISFTVGKADAKKAVQIVKSLAKEVGAEEVKLDENIAKVSIVGVGMRSHSGVAAKMFQALAVENINIMMISTSEIKISCVIDSKYAELAVRALHDAFELSNSPVSRE